MLKITYRNALGRELELMISSKQKIKETIRVLNDNPVYHMSAQMPDYVMARRKNRRIPTELTYEQAAVYEGDILEIPTI